MEERIFVRCEDHDIPMVIAYPEDKEDKYPTMLLLHGFLSYKEGDGYLFRKTAEKFAENGIATARIDFCSMGENRYSRQHYGLEVMLKETKAAFDFLSNHPKIDVNRIGILGHSLGGRVTFLSSTLPSKCLVSFNGAIDVAVPRTIRSSDMFNRNDKEDYTIMKTSDGRVELLFNKFHEDAHNITSDAIYSYANPILVCVGVNDPTLDPNVSYNFVKNCNMKQVELLEIENANHTFNAKTGDYTKVYELLDKVNLWLDKNLK